MADQVALVYWGSSTLTGNFNETIQLSGGIEHLTATIETVVRSKSASWVLFWDFALGDPDIVLIEQLIKRPQDVFHAGLKLGLGGLPNVMNYVDPIWMYNIDCDPNIEHTSFRMSLKACLIRTKVLKAILPLSQHYSCIEMLSIATGYRLIKSGAIMRYIPDLVLTQSKKPGIAYSDEWVFSREFYTTKWQLWIAIHKPRPLNNLKNWYRSRHVRYRQLAPCIHNSQEADISTEPKTISILAPTLDRYPYLHNELKQLSAQTILPTEVLITDQTDIDRRKNIDTSQYPQLTVRVFPQNDKGQCIAWNKLIEESKGEYIFFFGDDADNITPDFLQRMLHTMQKFDADMVASNVIEIGIPTKPVNHHYYSSDTFPITLIKRSMVEKSGYMDMFFNKNVRADKDLATRCHLNGCLMIFNPTATIDHHRAPVGGLRAHKARVITNYIAKNSITRFALPTSSEIYFVKKYFNDAQYRIYMRTKYLNQLFVSGSIFKSFLKVIVFLSKYPAVKRQYRQNLALAQDELNKISRNKR